jgi:hypothetical protein
MIALDAIRLREAQAQVKYAVRVRRIARILADEFSSLALDDETDRQRLAEAIASGRFSR